MKNDHDWGAIKVWGARENSLPKISLDLPKRKLSVFTGVSGSGKSSLVLETIAAESRRLFRTVVRPWVFHSNLERLPLASVRVDDD
jgi:excinuclease UvrABC ATPase subunit